MKTVQNRTFFVISTLFENEGVRMSFYFCERGASSKQGCGNMVYDVQYRSDRTYCCLKKKGILKRQMYKLNVHEQLDFEECKVGTCPREKVRSSTVMRLGPLVETDLTH